MKASEAAVKSIIGEVFSDVSFEEFERSSSTVSECVCALDDNISKDPPSLTSFSRYLGYPAVS